MMNQLLDSEDIGRLRKKNDAVRAMAPEVLAQLQSRLPAFVTFPRTGSQWLDAVIEKYTDRPCLRERRATLIQPERTDWLFFHDHDPGLKLQHDHVLYLYRSPVETIYSYLIYRFNSSRRKSMWGRWRQRGEQAITPKKIENIATAYRQHLEKWLLSDQRARTSVRYERLQTHPIEEFGRICDFFQIPLDRQRLQATLQEASRGKMVEIAVKKVALNPWLLSNDYQVGRQEFREKHGQRIRDMVITPDLAPFFKHLDDAD